MEPVREIKLQCDCGQKFKFDVAPVNGQMPFAVNCPACGKDGTPAANAILSSAVSIPTPPPPLSTAAPAPAAARIQINRPVQSAASAIAPQPTIAPPAPGMAAAVRSQPKATGEFNLGLGILGALLGAGIGMGAMYGFYELAGFRFPLLGVGIGVLTGYGAKLLYKGTDITLGVIAGAIALVAVVGTLYLMYGAFPIVSIVSVIISIGMAYRIASG